MKVGDLVYIVTYTVTQQFMLRGKVLRVEKRLNDVDLVYVDNGFRIGADQLSDTEEAATEKHRKYVDKEVSEAQEEFDAVKARSDSPIIKEWDDD